MTQKYDKEFKRHAVQLAFESRKPASQVTRDLDISQKKLYGWMSKYKKDPSTPFVRSGNLKTEAKILRDLERVHSSIVYLTPVEYERRYLQSGVSAILT
ncbi:transposase [Alicyclobacillus sp. TC]|uniref:Transposase n=1 Tax=Alicyclobacillus tolerans TaxID=90970 RepID=A0ABT9LX35_9BACL|nr:transposase [Alicyclobacillus tengchongensis]QRF23177.1 transposase [Alicyclobacillus sp. TC]